MTTRVHSGVPRACRSGLARAVGLTLLSCSTTLGQTAAPDSRTPITDTVEHAAKAAGHKVIAVARSAESSARQAVSDGYDWAEREGAQAKRPRGLYLFTPTPATQASGSAHADPGPDWTPLGAVTNQLPARIVLLVHGL